MAGQPEAASLDEHAPSWVNLGRSTVQGICDDLITAVNQLVSGLALTAVVLSAPESQPVTILGELRGKALDMVSLSDTTMLVAASSRAGAPVRDAVRQSLAAALRLADVRAFPLDTPETRIGLVLIGWESAGSPVAGDLAKIRSLCQQAALAIMNLTLRHELARAERLKRDAEALVRVSSDLAACPSSAALHSRIVSYAKDLVGAQLAYLALLDEEHQDLVVVTTAGERSSLWTGMRIPLNEGIAAQAIRDRITVMTPDLMTDSRRRPAWEGVRLAEDIHGSIWAPIFSGERLLGLLQVANRHVTQFTADEAGLLQSLADIAASAIQKTYLFEQNKQTNMELQRLSQLNLARCSEAQRQTAAMTALAAALSLGKGLDALAAALARSLNNPVIVCTQLRNVLVCQTTNGLAAAEVDQALTTALAQPQSPLSLALAKSRGRSRPRRVLVSGAPGESASCVTAPIIAGEVLVGYLLVPESVGPLQEADLIVLENALFFFAAEFLRRSEVSQAQKSLGSDLLLDLLESGASEHGIGQARLLGCSLNEPQGMAIIHMGPIAETLTHVQKIEGSEVAPELLLAAVRVEIESPSFATGFVMSALRDGLVVVVAPRNPHVGQWHDIHARLAAAFPRLLITMSVRESFQGLANVQSTYHHCLSALHAAMQLDQAGQIVQVERLGVYRILGKVHPREELVEFARDVLGGLLSEGPKYRPDLLLTLDAYLRNACRLHKAAEALFVHPHTLSYRIGRIEEMLGHSVDDAAWREEAQLALAIARMEFPGLFKTP